VFFDQAHRRYVPYDELPRDWVNAIVAAEDGNFWTHPGFDAKHIVRALWQNLRAGEVVAGGSTLTQQTAKNLFYRPDRTLRSKLAELGNALRLEAHFSKEDILEFYANQFHVSANGRGLGIAARYFFDKSPEQLTTKECAFLAGMVKAPATYNPFLGESEERREKARTAAEVRTRYVLGRMVEEGFLDAKTYEELVAQPLAFKRGTFQYDRSVVVDEVQRRLEEPAFIELFERLGIDNPSTAGIQIVTTLDVVAQREATWALWHHLTGLGALLERADVNDLRLPERTTMPMAPGVPLVPHEMYAAKVVSVGDVVALDVGGRPCTVDAEGVDRIVTVLTRARTGNNVAKAADVDRTAFVAGLAPGWMVLASARDATTCDLEIRPQLQGALVALEDGEVRAMVGGNDNRNFNRVTNAKRQLGSTWKPLVYETALHLGWLPTDTLDNRRNVFPFRDVWYYPRPDHPNESFLPLTLVGARSENLASVWLLHHVTDRVNPEQFRRLAVLVGLARGADETASDYVRRLVDTEAIHSTPDRFEEYAFTLARADVLSGLAFSPHPEDALGVRSLLHGRGFAAERARVAAGAASPERDARLTALGNNLLALEELARRCLEGEPGLLAADPNGVLACGRTPEGYTPLEGPPFVPPEDFLVDGRIHLTTLRALREAVDARAADLDGKDPWDPEVLALNPDFRVLVGVRYLQKLVGAFGVRADLPSVLSLPLGAADVSLLDAAVLYQGMLRGERTGFTAEGFDAGTVSGLRAAFTLPPSADPAALIAEIRDAEGNVLYRAHPEPHVVADPVSAEVLGDVLRNVVRLGTGRRAASAVTLGGAPLPLAGKTGTTNDYRNAAFIGIAPTTGGGELRWGQGWTIAAYVGYDDNHSMKRGSFRAQGASGALPAWLGLVEGLATAGLLGPGGSAEYSPSDAVERVLLDPGVPDGPSALVPVGGERRFAPFGEAAAVAPGGAEAPPTLPLVDEVPAETVPEEGAPDPPPAPLIPEVPPPVAAPSRPD
jgi:penicillin-binding protein 1A